MKKLLILLYIPLIFSCGDKQGEKIKKLEDRDELEKITPKQERESSDKIFHEKEEPQIHSETYYLGESIFKSTCAACHNLPGGGKLIGQDLKDILTKERFVNTEDPTVTFIKYVQNPIEFGITTMPPQALDVNQVVDVLEFINNYEPRK